MMFNVYTPILIVEFIFADNEAWALINKLYLDAELFLVKPFLDMSRKNALIF